MTRFLVPLAASLLLLFAIAFVIASRPRERHVAPPAPPPRSPYPRAVAGAGLVESSSENISVGSPTTGIVSDVLVSAGQTVAVGDPLLRLDTRSLTAELKVREAKLDVARAELARLTAQPRAEQIPLLEATVRQQQANVAEKEDHYRRLEELHQKNAVAEGAYQTAQQELKIARSRLEFAEADLALLLAGAWQPELTAARAAVKMSEAQVGQTLTELERLTIRARTAAKVLQVNVHPGEFVTAFGNQSLLVLGSVERLHVRVDIDENDIPRFQPGAAAVGMLKANGEQPIPLEFHAIQPLVIPKKSLTGENTERVDTRVLQVIYAVGATDVTLYVGQQLDVFIEAE